MLVMLLLLQQVLENSRIIGIFYIMMKQGFLTISIIVASLFWATMPCLAKPIKHTATATPTAHHKYKSQHGKQGVTQKKPSAIAKQHKKHKKNATIHKAKVPARSRQRGQHAVTSIPAYAIRESTNSGDSAWFISSISHRLVDFVHKTVSTVSYNAYKLGGEHFDISRGIYILDCSRYVDRLLQMVNPKAYSSLVSYTGAVTPTSQHYYEFFTGLAEDPNHFWHAVDEVEKLQPGDILVFRYKNRRGGVTGGHVMIVMSKPIRDNNTFLVRIADSAPTRHSQDTRQSHDSGIGIGTLLLKVNPVTHQPAAYAWGVGSYWNHRVDVVMARPVDV